jgi:hypothetical protein
MATMVDLISSRLERLDPELPAGSQEVRLVYLAERAARWIEDQLPNGVSNWNLESSPLEQVFALFQAFCGGEDLIYSQTIRDLKPAGAGVWELKTADVRMFGWFFQKDCFVAVCADYAWRVKEYNLYAGYTNEVVRYIRDCDLDPTWIIASQDPADVVSNCHRP